MEPILVWMAIIFDVYFRLYRFERCKIMKIRLNNVDLAWLRMENPTNPMRFTVAIRFKGQLNYYLLIEILEDTFRHYRRFWQRIVVPSQIFRRPYWESDPSYRVENHVKRVTLPLPADDAALGELINREMNTALDFTHPLWKITLVDNHPEGSIIIVHMHHCIGDGISLMQVLLRMTQTPTEVSANPQTVGQATPTNSEAKSGRDGLYRKPGLIDMIAALLRILFRSPDPPTILKGQLGQVKRAVWSEPFCLPEIKQIAQSKQATINDVLMAITSGAIRRYTDLHHDDRKGDIRAFTMVNLRGNTFDEELGNKFGLVFLTLPLRQGQPLERLEWIKQGMDNLKASAEYAVTYIILNILGFLPPWIEHLATKFLDTKGTLVATNVSGPRGLLYLADAPIQSIMGWVPQSGRIGVGLSFISYNNQLVVGLNADVGLIPDPEKFIQLFTEEYKSFQAAVN